MRDFFVAYAQRFIGVPYRWGGENSITGFDCSGLVSHCLNAVGIMNGRVSAQDLHTYLLPISSKIKIPAYLMCPGTILFYGPGLDHITHTGICVGQGLMVSAAGGGSETTTKELADLANAFVKVEPIAQRKGLLEGLLPNALA